MQKILGIFVLFGLVLGCGHDQHGQSKPQKKVEVKTTFQGQGPLKAVCTTGMVADLVRNVGKQHVLVEQIMGPDVDPHLYKPTTVEINKLQTADIIFYNGLHLEGKMGEVLERLSRKTPAFGIGEFLDPSRVLHDENNVHDPHIWFDVDLWLQASGVVAEALAKFDPAHAAEYRNHAAAYQQELATLDGWARKEIAAIPKAQAVLITSHDAFKYFGKRYGLEVRGIQGISTEAEASVRDVEDLVTLIVDRKIKAVFVETSVNPRAMRSLIEGCQARGHKLAEGGELFSDAMGSAGTREGTYVGMIEHNVHTMVKALR